MRIKSPKDFWAGLMFIGTGLFFAIWAYAYYQMGTAVRMGPAYFPFLLGGLLVFLGALVFIEGFVFEGTGEPLHLPFNIVDLIVAVAIFAVMLELAPRVGLSVDWGMILASVVLSVLTVIFRPEAKALVLISVACLVYGYSMKPLGLVGATAALVFISAYGGHEFKWKEVFVLFLILMAFSYLVFVKGLTLPFPMCPAAFSFC